MKIQEPYCPDTRPCFARNNGRCRILNKTYQNDGECTFCKPDKEDTPATMKAREKAKKSNFKHGW